MYLLAGLVTDVEFTFYDDLHLVVGICVNERCALFQSVETSANGLLWVELLAGSDIAEVCVLVGDQRGFVRLLSVAEVCECWCRAHLVRSILLKFRERQGRQ